MNDPQHHLVLLVAVGVAALAAVYDWRKGEIPGSLLFAALTLAPLLHVARFAIAKAPHETLYMEGSISLAGAALAAIVPLILYRQSAIGGGDVKLLVALGAILQPMMGIEAQMYGFFALAILAPAKLAYDGKLLATIHNAAKIGANLFLPRDRQKSIDATTYSWFRLGPAVFLGVALTAYLHW